MAHPEAAPDTVQSLRPGWKQLVMVCKACEKRSQAPKKLSAKKLARALAAALRVARQPKTRIVQTSCLGLCPKRAVAVAATAADGKLHVIAWRKTDSAGAAMKALLAADVAADPSSPTLLEKQ